MKYKDITFIWSDCNKKYELRADLTSGGCMVIAFFDCEKEGYSMRTVGDRFFRYTEASIVAKHAIAFLQEIFELEQSIN